MVMVAVRIPSSPPLSSSPIFFSLFLPHTSSNFSFVSSPRASSGSRWGLSRSSRGGRCKASAENEQTQFEIDPERAREALKKLDQQFQTLSQKQAVLPKKNKEPTNDMPTSSYTDSDRAMKAEDLPELSESFITYSTVALLVLTFITNMVFIIFIKPAVDGN